MSRNSTLRADFEADLKVLKRSRLSRNHEYNSLLQTVEKFQRELKLSSLQCKDRNQLNQQWEDQQFYRILVRMMHEVTTTTGMKQKEDLKKVYRWYQTNKTVLHSQPHFKGADSKETYKRPVLKFAPDALKYYSTPHDRRKQKRVAFDGDGKARRRQQGLRQRNREDRNLSDESEEGLGRGGSHRPVTAPAGLHRPKVSNSLPKSPESSRPGSRQDDGSLAASYVIDNVSASSPDFQTLQRPSSALGIIQQSQTYDLDSMSGDLRTKVSPEDYLTSTPSNQTASSVSIHVPRADDTSESTTKIPTSPGRLQGTNTGLESGSETSILTKETDANMAAMLKYKHPIPTFVNPVARFDEELYDGGQSPDERCKSPVKLQMHVDIPNEGTSESHPKMAQDEKTINLLKWQAYQDRQDHGQDIAAKQTFYGHGGLPTNIRYASHDGGEMPEFYTQEVISSYSVDDRMYSPQGFSQPVDAIISPSLEQFYEITERHSPQIRPSSGAGRYADLKQSYSAAGYLPDEDHSPLRNNTWNDANRPRTVKFESVVDLADQVGDQLAIQKEKLTPEPRYGYRQPMLKISPVHPRPHSAKPVLTAASPPADERHTPPHASPSGPSLTESSKLLFAPPNSSRQSTCSSSDFTPRNKRGDPIILLPETSQYTMHLRRMQGQNAAHVPHAINKQGRVVPDQQRYSRARSAPGKRNLRSAGSSSGGYRPRTATNASPRHEWSSTKQTIDEKVRIPQAASHNTVSIGPRSLASMMVVNHLGNEQRRGRSRMGGPGYYLDEEFESSPPMMEYMSFTGPVKLTTRAQEKALSIPTDETHLSDVTPLNVPSQASPLESIPSQDWLYRQGSSNGVTEGQELPGSSQGYADSLNAGSERTDDRSLSQDLRDLDEVDDADCLDRSHDSQDLGSELLSSGVGSLNLDNGSAASYTHDNLDDCPDHQDADLTDAGNVETTAAGIDLKLEGEQLEGKDNPSEDLVDEHKTDISTDNASVNSGDKSMEEASRGEGTDERPSEDDQLVNGQASGGEEDHSLSIQDLPATVYAGDGQDLGPVVSPESDRESFYEAPSDHRQPEDSAVQNHGETPDASYSNHFDNGNGSRLGDQDTDEENRQAPEEILNRHFLAVTRGSVNRPRSANPRLYEAGEARQNHYHGKGRPASAREETVPSVFTIEIGGGGSDHSSGSLHTVPIAYMSLSEEHRNQLQMRTLPLVDQQGPHYRGHHQRRTVISPAVTKKPLTPRGSARNSPLVSPHGSDRSASPALSVDMSPVGTRENSLYSPISSRSASPMTLALQAHLDNLEESGRLESMMPNLMMQMGQPLMYEDGPPEPPASIDENWSNPQQETSPGHHLSPPQIQIQRPSSAPPSRTDSSPSAASSRPSSARVSRPARASTGRAPSLGTSSSPTRPRPVSSTSHGKEWKGRPLPMYGSSRDVEAESRAIQLAQEAKSSVNIRDLFSGSATKEYRKDLERQERERWEKQNRDSQHLNRFYKDYMMRQEIAMAQRPDIMNKDWARGYLSDKMLKDRMRQEKWSQHMRQQAMENRKALSLLKRIGPSVDIWELFHGGKRGVTKAQMKKAAITIQKYVRGWVVRTMLEKVKQKSRVHAGSFKGFVKYYSQLMKRIARWHGVKKPAIHLDLWQMDEFMDRKRYYEYVFAKRSHPNDSITIRDLDGFFKECDHYPSRREIFNAISGATKKDAKKLDSKLSEKEVVEVTFMIYVPQGSTLNPKDTRKSTWLNPLVDGSEAKKLMGSDEVEKVEYAKSLQLVFAAFQERQEMEKRVKKIEEKKQAEAAAATAAENKNKNT